MTTDKDEVPGSSPGRPTNQSSRSERRGLGTGGARFAPGPHLVHLAAYSALCESGSCWTLWLRLLGDSFGTRFGVLGDTGSGRWAGPRRSLEMHQMTGSVDSTLRLFDLADEGRFLLMSHVWRLDKRDESRERRGPG
jgi:hypothetical protein